MTLIRNADLIFKHLVLVYRPNKNNVILISYKRNCKRLENATLFLELILKNISITKNLD